MWGSPFNTEVPNKITEKINLLGIHVLIFVLLGTFAAVPPKVEYQQVLGMYRITTSECVRYTCGIPYNIRHFSGFRLVAASRQRLTQ